jgi:hypothetical protein
MTFDVTYTENGDTAMLTFACFEYARDYFISVSEGMLNDGNNGTVKLLIGGETKAKLEVYD